MKEVSEYPNVNFLKDFNVFCQDNRTDKDFGVKFDFPNRTSPAEFTKFETPPYNVIYLSFIQRRGDRSGKWLMENICQLADKHKVDILLQVVPNPFRKDSDGFAGKPLSEFKKAHNEAKEKLEIYFKSFGFETFKKENETVPMSTSTPILTIYMVRKINKQ